MSNVLNFPKPGSLLAIEEGNQLQARFDLNPVLPCITQEVNTNEVLMLGFMNKEALSLTIETGYAHYFSRARQGIWKKGERSGQIQLLKHILIDDDQDCLLLKVEIPKGASCHVGYRSCFFRELKVNNLSTDFKLDFLESEKVFDPEVVYQTIYEKK